MASAQLSQKSEEGQPLLTKNVFAFGVNNSYGNAFSNQNK
jgi:hypothetical protein